MCKLIIFGGTTEGRELAEFCADNSISAYISVTTEYGAELLPRSEYLHILTERLDREQLSVLFAEKKIALVIDATHPYAVEASKNIAAACTESGIRLFRVVRNEDNEEKSALYFDNTAEVVDFLNENEGNVLITTGSKELSEFCKVNLFSERCTARVLNVTAIADMCRKIGFEKIISEKGPFSIEQNIVHLKKAKAKYVVTKDSGAVGGFQEKIVAAHIYCAVPLIIRRPKENGVALDDIKKILITEKSNG